MSGDHQSNREGHHRRGCAPKATDFNEGRTTDRQFLKVRFGLGYARLCDAVGDSLSWRRFCRIGLEAQVPDESTLRKITRRCGPELIEGLNVQLLTGAHERGVVDLERVRVDTTVVEADIKYPTDSGLLTSAICRISSRLRRLANVGVRVSFVDRTAAGACASALDRRMAATPHRRGQERGAGDHRAARRSR